MNSNYINDIQPNFNKIYFSCSLAGAHFFIWSLSNGCNAASRMQLKDLVRSCLKET